MLELLAGGLPNAEIADTLVVEELRDRVQAVILAYETGLVGRRAAPRA